MPLTVHRAGRVLAVGIVLAVAAACGGDATTSGPSTPLVVRLRSPNTVEGAAVFRVRGAGVPEPQAEAGTLFTRPLADGWSVVVLLDTAGVPRFRVPTDAEAVQVELVQVAAPDNTLRTDLSGYTVEVAR